MLEHEAKILNINTDEVQKKLVALGAKKILSAVTYIEGYDFDPTSSLISPHIPDKFQRLVKHIVNLRGHKGMFSQGAYLRIRQEGSKFELIFKQKTSGTNSVKSEIEISIPILESEWETVAAMLLNMGLHKIVVQEKKRVSYIYPPYRYDIDTWPGVPTYLEVEAPTPEGVLHAIALLGFTREEAVALTAAEVFELYNIANPRYLIFGEEK